MDADYQGILHFGHFALRVNGSQVIPDLQFYIRAIGAIRGYTELPNSFYRSS